MHRSELRDPQVRAPEGVRKRNVTEERVVKEKKGIWRERV